MEKYEAVCIYEIEEDGNNKLDIVEYAPQVFREIRQQNGVSEDILF
jgi:hypothetical protein